MSHTKTVCRLICLAVLVLTSPVQGKVVRSAKVKYAAGRKAKRVAGVPVVADASSRYGRSHGKKPALPVSFSPVSGSREPSTINFNSLIKHAGKNQTRLEKRVKVKTAGTTEKWPSVSKVSNVDFEDVNLRVKKQASPAPKAPHAPMLEAEGESAPFTLSLRSKKD